MNPRADVALSPTHLVLLAGDSLWPHLDSLAQWRGSLERVVLVPPHGAEAAGGPVQRLRTFVNRTLPGVAVSVTAPVNDDAPAELEAVLGSLVDAAPEGSWMVNASGATTLMVVGADRVARTRPDVAVVFRDEFGPWYRLDADGAVQIETDADALDDVNVVELLRATWSDADNSVKLRAVHESRPSREMVGAARRCIAGTDAMEAFADAFDRMKRHRDVEWGFEFEKFVVALLHEFGLDHTDVVLGATLLHRRRAVQEIDVVAQVNGRLHLIDCKAGTALYAPIGMQIREAVATQEQLGDDSSRVMLLRPQMPLLEENRSFAHSLDVGVVDANRLREVSLPDALRAFLGLVEA